MKSYALSSMTGYGRAQGETELGRFIVEVRTVNNRFQDISLSLPRDFGALEPLVRQELKSAIARGKIDCRVRFVPVAAAQNQVVIHQETAKKYIEELTQLKALGIADELSLQVLVGLPGVVEVLPTEQEEDALWGALAPILKQAVGALLAERKREGEALAQALDDMIERLRSERGEVDRLKNDVVEKYRARMLERLTKIETECQTPLDPGRLEAEVAVIAEKCDIEEELTRLEVHLDRFAQLLTEDQASVGKNLDFLVQEIFREINTICSKARESDVASHGINMKNLVEQIREQIQNIQ